MLIRIYIYISINVIQFDPYSVTPSIEQLMIFKSVKCLPGIQKL